MRKFRCGESIKLYIFPILKIIFFSLLIVLLINRNYLVRINSYFWNTVFSIVCFIIVILLSLCIYLAVGEIILLSERRAKANMDTETIISYCKYFSVDHVLSLIELNDIIEISIISNNRIIKIGASSDCCPGSSEFFNKSYFINDMDNVTIEYLCETINNFSVNGKVCVVAIDDEPRNLY